MSGKKGGLMIFGAIVGFVAGLFLAPKKGSELRRDAKEKFDDIKENPEETFKSTFESMKNKLDTFSETLFEVDEDGYEDVDLDDEDIVISRTFKEVEDDMDDDIVLDTDKEEEEL